MPCGAQLQLNALEYATNGVIISFQGAGWYSGSRSIQSKQMSLTVIIECAIKDTFVVQIHRL